MGTRGLYIRCTRSHICCMRFCGRINSPQNSGHTHYLEQPKAIGKLLQCNARTLVGTFYNVLCTLKSDTRFLKIVRLILAVYVCP